jgi:hypothetical protein
MEASTSQNDTLAKCRGKSGPNQTPGEAEQIGPDTASSSAEEIFKSLTWQGAKGARSLLSTLLSLLQSQGRSPYLEEPGPVGVSRA